MYWSQLRLGAESLLQGFEPGSEQPGLVGLLEEDCLPGASGVPIGALVVRVAWPDPVGHPVELQLAQHGLAEVDLVGLLGEQLQLLGSGAARHGPQQIAVDVADGIILDVPRRRPVPLDELLGLLLGHPNDRDIGSLEKLDRILVGADLVGDLDPVALPRCLEVVTVEQLELPETTGVLAIDDGPLLGEQRERARSSVLLDVQHQDRLPVIVASPDDREGAETQTILVEHLHEAGLIGILVGTDDHRFLDFAAQEKHYSLPLGVDNVSILLLLP